jgi:hypothetical protein
MIKLKQNIQNAAALLGAIKSTNTPNQEEIEKILDEEEANIREPRKVYTLKLTTNDLIHLRDLFGIKMPAMLDTTLSQMLAKRENRPYSEALLWNKIGTLCTEANVALEDDSPEFTLALSGIPEIRVVELVPEPIENMQIDDDEDEEDETCEDDNTDSNDD